MTRLVRRVVKAVAARLSAGYTSRAKDLLTVFALVSALVAAVLLGTLFEARFGRGHVYADFADTVSRGFARGGVDEAQLMHGCFTGMVESLGDPYSEFMAPAKARDNSVRSSGEEPFTGIRVGLDAGRPVVIGVADSSPADEAGLKEGDLLVTASGEPVPPEERAAAALVVGPAGVPIVLVVERPGEGTREVTVTPRLVPSNPIRLEFVSWEGERFAHLFVPVFSGRTGKDFPGVVDRLLAMKPDGVVLDLRGNPGGTLESARVVAGAWVGQKTVYVLRDASGNSSVYGGVGDARLASYRTVVLVDGDSASAAEVVAGALQDHKLARVVGGRTFGKGVAQSFVAMEGGFVLKLTTALWFTPNGNSIDGVGITPDEEVEPGCFLGFGSVKDRQLGHAFVWLATGE